MAGSTCGCLKGNAKDAEAPHLLTYFQLRDPDCRTPAVTRTIDRKMSPLLDRSLSTGTASDFTLLDPPLSLRPEHAR